MATYVNDLRLTELATGEGSGTWGTTTNTNLELIGEALGYGTQDCFASDADATTTVDDGVSDPARAMYFKVTSSATLTATRTLTIAPNTVSRVMLIENATTGSQSIAISQGSGGNVTIASGQVKMVYLDGAGSGAAVVDAMASLELGTITVANLTATTADINGGTIDGATIGGASAAAGTFTTLNATGGGALTGTWTDLGSVTTVDINGGTIDGATIATSDITVGAGKTLDVSAGTFTVANDQISGDAINGGTATPTTLTSTTVNATTVDTTNIELTNLKAKDGTAAGSIADSTGVVTLASSVLTTTDINGGTIDGVTIGGSSAGAGSFTTLTASGSGTFGNLVVTNALGTVLNTVANAAPRLFGSTSVLYNAGIQHVWEINGLGSPSEQMRLNGTGLGIGTSSPATALDVVGTVTADGLTVESSDNATGAVTTLSNTNTSTDSNTVIGVLIFENNDGSAGAANAEIKGLSSGTNGQTDLYIRTGSSGTLYNRAKFDFTGDISFYEDTGTTPKFFWDASAEALGIGTSSPSSEVDILGSSSRLRLDGSAASFQILSRNTSDSATNALTFDADTYTFNRAGSTQATIDSSGNVGIGTTSPSSALDIQTGTGNLQFGVVGSASGQIAATNTLRLSAGAATTDPIQFYTAGSEAARIDTSGNLLVGKTSVSGATAGFEANTGGFVATADSSFAGWMNRKTNDGDILRFNKDGTEVGAIGASSGDMFVGTGDTGILFNDFGNQIRPTNAGATNDATIDIGTTGHRFKDLYLSGGVYLGGTGAANLLDDYEEGTWTPGITFGGNAVGVTYGSREGRYVKVGNAVTVYWALPLTNKGSSSGAAVITGLPFTALLTGAATLAPFNLSNSGYTWGQLAISTNVALYTITTAGSRASLTDTDFTNSTSINGSITYIV